MQNIGSLYSITRKALLNTFSDAVVPKLAPARWSIVVAKTGAPVYGVVFGRRTIDQLGVVLMLALQLDGSFEPFFVPADAVVPADEPYVRRRFVCDHRMGYASPEHPFTASAVVPQLCTVCADVQLPHERNALRSRIERTLGTLEIEVTFAKNSAKVTDLKVRPQPTDEPIMNPVPGDPAAVKPRTATPILKREFRALNDKERHLLNLVLPLNIWSADVPPKTGDV